MHIVDVILMMCFYGYLQNALRAVVEYHGEDAKLPNVQVLISKGREDVTIKVTRNSKKIYMINIL